MQYNGPECFATFLQCAVQIESLGRKRSDRESHTSPQNSLPVNTTTLPLSESIAAARTLSTSGAQCTLAGLATEDVYAPATVQRSGGTGGPRRPLRSRPRNEPALDADTVSHSLKAHWAMQSHGETHSKILARKVSFSFRSILSHCIANVPQW